MRAPLFLVTKPVEWVLRVILGLLALMLRTAIAAVTALLAITFIIWLVLGRPAL
jgi:hypothetical protein